MEKAEYSRMFTLEGNFWWYVSLHEITVRSIRRQFKGKKSLRILDAGCGTGRMLELASEFGKTYGIDFSKDAVSFCRKRGLKNVSQKNLNTWKPGTKFDVIICNDVLYHSAIVNDKAILEKFYNALVPGGILILHLAAFGILHRHHDNIVHGSRRYRRKPVRDMLQTIGFSIQKSTYRMSFLFIPLLLKRVIEKRTHPSDEVSDLNPVHPLINTGFLLASRAENRFISIANAPFGSSLFVVARKD